MWYSIQRSSPSVYQSIVIVMIFYCYRDHCAAGSKSAGDDYMLLDFTDDDLKSDTTVRDLVSPVNSYWFGDWLYLFVFFYNLCYCTRGEVSYSIQCFGEKNTTIADTQFNSHMLWRYPVLECEIDDWVHNSPTSVQSRVEDVNRWGSENESWSPVPGSSDSNVSKTSMV